MLTICAKCHKELQRGDPDAREPAPPSPSLNGAVACSHGICYECGVKLYGAEIMARAGAAADRMKKSEGCLQNPDRFNIL